MSAGFYSVQSVFFYCLISKNIILKYANSGVSCCLLLVWNWTLHNDGRMQTDGIDPLPSKCDFSRHAVLRCENWTSAEVISQEHAK